MSNRYYLFREIPTTEPAPEPSYPLTDSLVEGVAMKEDSWSDDDYDSDPDSATAKGKFYGSKKIAKYDTEEESDSDEEEVSVSKIIQYAEKIPVPKKKFIPVSKAKKMPKKKNPVGVYHSD